MARRALSPDCLALVAAVEAAGPPALAATGCARLRVGLSGGADSLALAAAVAWAAARRRGPLAGCPAEALVVDHGLQAGSAAAAARAAAAAERLGLPAAVRRVTVTAAGDGLEAAARTARYGALLDDPAALALVAHTLDDQAETVLLGLARGSGPRSLAGMPDRAGRLLRPCLRLRRHQTAQACRDWGLEPWADPMNHDPAYSRVRARQALATLETALGPGLAEALARTADLCAEDADLLDALAATAARRLADAPLGGPTPRDPAAAPPGAGPVPAPAASALAPAAAVPPLPAVGLADLPAALRGRVLLAWLRAAGATDLSLAHRRAVEALVLDWRGQAGADLPGGRVVRSAGRLRWQPAGPTP